MVRLIKWLGLKELQPYRGSEKFDNICAALEAPYIQH